MAENLGLSAMIIFENCCGGLTPNMSKTVVPDKDGIGATPWQRPHSV